MERNTQKSLDGVCGEDYEHEEEVVWDDGETIYWECTHCGSIGYDTIYY